MQFRRNKLFFTLLMSGIFLLVENTYADLGEDSLTEETTRKRSIISLHRTFSLYETISGKPSDKILGAPLSTGLFHDFMSGLSVGGYYRGYFYSRRMTEAYGNNRNKVMSIGDGYFDPGLLLYIGGNPTPNTSFGADILVQNPFEAWHGPGFMHSKIIPYFTMVLRGNFATKIGNFNVVAGGIEWLRLTPFTFGSNVGYNRYSIFERRPWDPVGTVKTRYSSYYYNGTINQDARWGTQGFKGFIVNGFFSKINTNLDVFYGKAQYTGGILRENTVRPASNLGIRIKKNINSENYISLNTFNSYATSDSVKAVSDVQWNIYTTEYQFKLAGIMLSGELGMGRYMSPSYKESWGEGILADLFIPKKFTFLPLSIRYFQLDQSFTSNVANFNNVSIREVNTGYNNPNIPVLTPFGGNMESVGDLNNNRRGMALNTDIKVWNFVFSLGTQNSAEMSLLPGDTVLNYTHRINNLLWSRLPGVYPLVGMFGPNNRVGTYYRNAYERVNVSERNPDGSPQYKRYYNSLDLQMKFKAKFISRDMYINYLGSFNSVGNHFRAFTSFGDDAYIRTHYHEAELYYQLFPELILAFYTGLEKVKGNQATDLGPNGLPRDQTGEALGIGFDFAISRQTTLFLRQRWFSFNDKNFPGERFSGNEATIEFKIFF